MGVVISDFKKVSKNYDYNQESIIQMREDLTEALIGLEFFSHIHVIYHQHRKKDWLKLIGVEGEEAASLTIPFPSEPACQGVYSSRSPSRPSALGSCVVELVRCTGSRLYVKGLDAIDGTPVLDIKIYIPDYDAFPLAETPLNWCKGNDLITTSRHLHWDTINVGLTLGLRAGAKALQVIKSERGEAVRAEVAGSHFFAQGVEAATGCNAMRGNMIFKELHTSPGQWKFKLVGENSEVEITFHDHIYSGAAEVLAVDDQVIFSSLRKKHCQ